MGLRGRWKQREGWIESFVLVTFGEIPRCCKQIVD